MDSQEFEEKLGDAINAVLTEGFYEEDLGPFTMKVDYRQDEENDGQHR